MLLSDRKESPVRGITGLGGGIASYIFSTPEGYEISRSLRLTSADSSYLSRTTTVGDRRTWTWSGWVKRNLLGTEQNLLGTDTDTGLYFQFQTSDNFRVLDYTGSIDNWQISTTRLFRDPSAWYHIVFAFDSTAAAAADRMKLYINGVEETDTTRNNPTQNFESVVNNASTQTIGRLNDQYYCDATLADVHFVDGKALSASDFGLFDDDGVWQPKQYDGGYLASNSNLNFSREWSSGSTTGTPFSGTFAQVFNNIETSTYSDGNSIYAYQSPVTLNFSPALPAGAIEVWARAGSTGAVSDNITFSDGTSTYTTGDITSQTAQWVSVDSGNSLSNITSVTVNSGATSQAGMVLGAIRIGGVKLVNSDISNSFHLTFSDNTNPITLGADSSGLANNFTPDNIFASTDQIYADFPGNTDTYLRKSGSGVVPTNGDFTIECHFYPHSSSVIGLFDGGAGQTNIIRQWPANQVGREGGSGIDFAGDYTVNQWNHLAVTYDAATDDLILYVNGFESGSVASLTNIQGGSNFDIGTINGGGDGRYDGFIRNVRVTQDVVYTSEFTPPSHLDNLSSITDTSLLAITTNEEGLTGDASPNNYTLTNNGSVTSVIQGGPTVTDSLIDTPVNQTAESGNNGGNYCTFNPLNNVGQTLKQGNLVCSGVSGRVAGTMYVSSGKYYWECTASNDYVMTGIERSDAPYAPAYPGENDKQWAIYGNGGSGGLYHNDSSSSFPGFVEGDVIGHALDMDNGELSFYKNGTLMSSGPAVTGLSGAWTPQCRSGSGSFDGDTLFNFGQREFTYTPPTGFVSLCTQNLSDSDVTDGSDAMDVVTWDGNDTQRDIGGLEFSPDLVWIKKTNTTSNHSLQDTMRGATKNLVVNDVQSEGTEPQYLNAFNSDGFALGTSSVVNGTPDSYIAWAWDSGTSNTGIATGGLNNTVYNQTQTWSGGTTSGDATLGGNGFDKMFNGQFGSNGQTQSTGNAILTFTTPIDFNKAAGDKLELIYWQTFYVYTSAGTVTLNGGGTATNDFRDVTASMPNGSYTITGIGVNVARGMRVNGRTLIDNGVSVADYPTRSSTVRANQDAGFSIVKYLGNGTAGETIGHGLTSTPEFMIVRNYEINEDWNVYHKGLDESAPENYAIRFNQNTVRNDNIVFWDDTAPAATAFTVGDNSGTNGNNRNHIAYCWTPVDGYSYFNVYRGNGSANGPYIHTGFRPRWIMIKKIDGSTGDWIFYDTERDTYNAATERLYSNLNNGSTTASDHDLDILSNGFKVRNGTNTNFNEDGRNYIFAAFAETPFKNSRAR